MNPEELLKYVTMLLGLPEEAWAVYAQGDEDSSAIVIQIEGDYIKHLQSLVTEIENLLKKKVAP